MQTLFATYRGALPCDPALAGLTGLPVGVPVVSPAPGGFSLVVRALAPLTPAQRAAALAALAAAFPGLEPEATGAAGRPG